MKKIISICMLVVMLISLLSSCGVKNTNSSTETGTETLTDSNTETETNTDTSSDTNTNTTTDLNTETNTDTNSDTNTNTSTDTKTNTETSTDSNTETETDTSSDTETNTNTDTSTGSDVEIVENEKCSNQIYFEYVQQETIYYHEIKDYEETGISIGFPEEDGAYLKFIDSYEELTKYISVSNIDETIFEDHYVLCINRRPYFASGSDVKGYYNFLYENGKYSISTDRYFQETNPSNTNESMVIEMEGPDNYVVVPRNEIAYVEEIQKITINITYDVIKDFYWFAEYDREAELPEKPVSWVVRKNSQIQQQFGLVFEEFPDSDIFPVDTNVVLYLPTEPECDFIIKKKEVKDGDLYLVVEAFINNSQHYYLKKNDVRFYDLFMSKKSDLLSENYNVYITVYKYDTSVNMTGD